MLGISLPCSARIWIGWIRNWRASATIGPGIVAENSIVWRAAGTMASSFSMSGRKPRSSISSASSSTRMRASDELQVALLGEVEQPPGRADDDVDALACSASICGS